MCPKCGDERCYDDGGKRGGGVTVPPVGVDAVGIPICSDVGAGSGAVEYLELLLPCVYV